LEASNRVGGRLYTHHFSNSIHDYYDVGAMRFPDSPIMERTFSLFKILGMEKRDLSPPPPIGSLIPYYLENKNGEPWSYNDIAKWGQYAAIRDKAADKDPFEVDKDRRIPFDVFQHSPGNIVKAAIEPLRKKLREDLDSIKPESEGWKLLMKYDQLTTRQFLGLPPPLPPVQPPPVNPPPPPPYNYPTIEWLETFNSTTGGYDGAFSETVLGSLNFDFNSPVTDTKWFCILGGAEQLALMMVRKVQQKPSLESRVTAIKIADEDPKKLEVTIENKGKAVYDGIFNSTPLGCLRQMDTSKAGLNYGTKLAARTLGYSEAIKVGIKFKRAWWIHDLRQYSVKQGGLGHSDLPIRTCVYPSYNIQDPSGEPAVLLCTYTLGQDAQRIATLISNASDHQQKLADEATLKEILLRSLAKLHKNDEQPEEYLYDMITALYVDHHAFSWYHAPFTSGAFAGFGPGQFSTRWGDITRPSGNIVNIGELSSAHHGWVVGALESAVHGMHSWLSVNRHIEGAVQAMEVLENAKPGNPFVGLPPYINANTSKWQSFMGIATRNNYLSQTESLSVRTKPPA